MFLKKDFSMFHVSCCLLHSQEKESTQGRDQTPAPRLVTSALYPFCHRLLLLNCCYLVFYRLSVSRFMFHQWLKDIVDAFCSGGLEIEPSLGSLRDLAVPCPIRYSTGWTNQGHWPLRFLYNMLYISWRGLQSSCYMFCIVYNVNWRHLTCWAETRDCYMFLKKDFSMFHVSCCLLHS